MSPDDQKRIEAMNSRMGNPLRLQLFHSQADRAGELATFCEALCDTLTHLELKREPLAEGQLPYFQIAENLRCAWVPKGEKLSLVLDALAWASGDQPPPAVAIDPPDLPAAIRLYLADACPHCQQVLAMLLPLGFVDPQIRVTLLDAQVHTEQSAKDDVRSVPTTLLDDFRWNGSFPLEELLNIIGRRSPANLGPTALEMMLASGQAERLAELMQTENAIFPAYYDLVTHPLWSVRLGAMVVAETLAETSPQLAVEMAQPLWERYAGLGAAAKGDLIYLLGEIGAKNYRDDLATIYETEDNPELRDALSETLEKLN
jgi:glutaredoxin